MIPFSRARRGVYRNVIGQLNSDNVSDILRNVTELHRYNAKCTYITFKVLSEPFDYIYDSFVYSVVYSDSFINEFRLSPDISTVQRLINLYPSTYDRSTLYNSRGKYTIYVGINHEIQKSGVLIPVDLVNDINQTIMVHNTNVCIMCNEKRPDCHSKIIQMDSPLDKSLFEL